MPSGPSTPSVAIRQEAIEILRGLIETIAITPADEGARIELAWDIVRMLALPEGGAVPDAYARR